MADELGIPIKSVHNWYQGQREKRGDKINILNRHRNLGVEVHKKLKQEFSKKQYLEPHEYTELAEKIGITRERLMGWYKRERDKTKSLKLEE